MVLISKWNSKLPIFLFTNGLRNRLSCSLDNAFGVILLNACSKLRFHWSTLCFYFLLSIFCIVRDIVSNSQITYPEKVKLRSLRLIFYSH